MAHTLPQILAQADSGALGGILFSFMMLIALVSFGLWVWSLIHCIKNKQLSDNNRIIGIILIVVLGILGSLIYLFLPKETEQ